VANWHRCVGQNLLIFELSGRSDDRAAWKHKAYMFVDPFHSEVVSVRIVLKINIPLPTSTNKPA